jgi:hypothetical protein
MKRTSVLGKGLLLAVLAIAIEAQAVTVTVVSNDKWTVAAPDGTPLGTAQHVCLQAGVPSTCPPGATLYGYLLPGWTASIPGATWIWARRASPNATSPITGATTPAAFAEFTLQAQFYLCDVPTGGSISIASDDIAEVFLNGASAPIVASTSHSTVATVNVPATSLAQGQNIIEVKVRNAANPADCASGEYRCNPAGVLLSASFQDRAATWPTCPVNKPVGTIEEVMCPVPQTGSALRVCGCILGNARWFGPDFSTCVTTCTGADGTTKYPVNARESLSCPAPLTGGPGSRTCQSTGNWSASDFSACVPPPTTCTGADGSTRFAVGAIEPVSCPPPLTGGPGSRTCQSTGNWSGMDFSRCMPPAPPPPICVGCMCGSTSRGQYATCPADTECKSRQSAPPPKPDWCAAFLAGQIVTGWFFIPTPADCDPQPITTSDWFCDR